MLPTPRPYQQAAIKAAITGLQGRLKRALVVLATGLGKTLTAAFIVRQMKAKRILFLVHNNFILDHAMSEFRLIFGEKTKMAVYNGMSKHGAQQAEIVFATWQTMGKCLKQWKRNHFDLVIVDEAHHTEADTYRPVAVYFIGAKLGITATPDRQDKSDIRSIFGPEVVDVTLEEAIARGWLPRIEYHVITDESLDDKALQKIAAEIRQGHRRFTMAEVNRRIFIRKRDKEIARIINGYNEKAVVFCASIKHAERMNKSLGLSSVFHSEAGADQQDTWRKNQATLDALKNGIIRRVCAVNAFNEGVNVPTVGLVAFCRVTGVMTIFRQQLGRGLRPGKDKLIVLDFVGNLERIRLVQEMMEEISDLHEEYFTWRERQREGYSRQRFEVSGHGFEFTFSDRIVDLMKVLERVEQDFYPSWMEASDAAQKLGFKTFAQYTQGYKQDPKLPSDPSYSYQYFPGADQFFGRQKKNFYPTWQEASKKARRLRLSSFPKYRKGYKQDSRLPASPREIYSDYPGNSMFFLGRERNYYPTWQQASKAATKLGLRTNTEYSKGYRKDPRLHSEPRVAFKNYPGDTIFFGRERKIFYHTWQQASRSAKRLKIKSRLEYQRRYKSDPRLSSYPLSFYKNFPGWPKFLGTDKRRPKK